jgi:hypothetical protein
VPRPWPAPSTGGASAGSALPHYVRVSRPEAAGPHTPPRLLEGAGIELDRTLPHPAGGEARWAALVRPCRRADLDRALEPLLAAGGTAGGVISLPLFDADA